MQGISFKDGVKIVRGREYYAYRLERLFFLEKEEIPGRFEKGANIIDYFWREVTEKSVKELIFEIKRLVTKYEPDIKLKAVSAGVFPLESGQSLLVIELECILPDSEEEEVMTFSKIKEAA